MTYFAKWDNPSAPSTLTLRYAALDAGPVPVPEFSTVVPDLLVTPASAVFGFIVCPPEKDADEIEMEAFNFSINPGVGEFTLIVRGLLGFLHDGFIYRYIVVT